MLSGFRFAGESGVSVCVCARERRSETLRRMRGRELSARRDFLRAASVFFIFSFIAPTLQVFIKLKRSLDLKWKCRNTPTGADVRGGERVEREETRV